MSECVAICWHRQPLEQRYATHPPSSVPKRTAPVIPPLRRTTAPPLEVKLPRDEAKARALIAWICATFYEVRIFAAVMTISCTVPFSLPDPLIEYRARLQTANGLQEQVRSHGPYGSSDERCHSTSDFEAGPRLTGGPC